MTCIDLMTKRSKQRKTTKAIELRWIASIWRQNDQKCFVTSQNIENNSKLQKYSNYDEFASIWSRNDKNIDLRCKQFKSKQSYKIDQSTMNCIDWMSKRSKQRKTPKVLKIQWLASIWWQNDQNNAKLRKLSNYDEFASIWRQNDQKCWVTSQNIENNAKLQKWSKYNDLHRFDDKTIKTTQNYESYRITMNCIDLTTKRPKQRKTTKAIKLRSICI